MVLRSGDMLIADCYNQSTWTIQFYSSRFHARIQKSKYRSLKEDTCDNSFFLLVVISDAVYLINNAFGNGPQPDVLDAGDVNCDCLVDVSDAVYVISFVFLDANPPCDIDGDRKPDC